MADDKLTDVELDALLKQAQRAVPQPSDAWLGRVTADAEAELRRRAELRIPFWVQVKSVLGGWQGMGGLVAACAAGVWLGIAPPTLIGDPVAVVFGGSQNVDLLSDDTLDYVALLDEG